MIPVPLEAGAVWGEAIIPESQPHLPQIQSGIDSVFPFRTRVDRIKVQIECGHLGRVGTASLTGATRRWGNART